MFTVIPGSSDVNKPSWFGKLKVETIGPIAREGDGMLPGKDWFKSQFHSLKPSTDIDTRIMCAPLRLEKFKGILSQNSYIHSMLIYESSNVFKDIICGYVITIYITTNIRKQFQVIYSITVNTWCRLLN